MSDFTPPKILAFLAACFIMLGLISFIFPEQGIALGKDSFMRFPSLASVFIKEEKTDITAIIDMEVASDTIEPEAVETIDLSKIHGLVKLDSGVQILPLGWKDNTILDNFFAALQTAGARGEHVRVMHYGDSQIEVDRITGYIRNRLQGQFGGSGPGFLNIMPVAEAMSFNNTWSTGWERYTAFTRKDARVPHRNYGPAAAFSRFMPLPDSANPVTEDVSAWLKVVSSKKGGSRMANFTNVHLFYGGSTAPVAVEVFADDVLVRSDTLVANGSGHALQIKTAQPPSTLLFNFKGKDSPDLYGISLEGDAGVVVDNLALRGSSGDFFTFLSQSQLKNYYDLVKVNLFILQFGGNTIPYLKDEAHAASYARSIAAQIRTLKNLQPEACILFVGPSDMSIKDGVNYITHPLLEALNNSLRSEVINAGGAYFDMYAAMGGKNSMVSWVDAGLATKDYIHFTPDGARRIAVLLYHALMQEYNNYIIRNS